MLTTKVPESLHHDPKFPASSFPFNLRSQDKISVFWASAQKINLAVSHTPFGLHKMTIPLSEPHRAP